MPEFMCKKPLFISRNLIVLLNKINNLRVAIWMFGPNFVCQLCAKFFPMFFKSRGSKQLLGLNPLTHSRCFKKPESRVFRIQIEVTDLKFVPRKRVRVRIPPHGTNHFNKLQLILCSL